MSQIIVDLDSPGVSVSAPFDKIGNRSSDTGRLTFTDVVVPLLRSYNRSMAAVFDGGQDTTRMATIAKLTVGRLAREAADTCLQFHGGLGYMEDH